MHKSTQALRRKHLETRKIDRTRTTQISWKSSSIPKAGPMKNCIHTRRTTRMTILTTVTFSHLLRVSKKQWHVHHIPGLTCSCTDFSRSRARAGCHSKSHREYRYKRRHFARDSFHIAQVHELRVFMVTMAARSIRSGKLRSPAYQPPADSCIACGPSEALDPRTQHAASTRVRGSRLASQRGQPDRNATNAVARVCRIGARARCDRTPSARCSGSKVA